MWGAGYRVWGLGFRVWALVCLEFGVWGLRCGEEGAGTSGNLEDAHHVCVCVLVRVCV